MPIQNFKFNCASQSAGNLAMSANQSPRQRTNRSTTHQIATLQLLQLRSSAATRHSPWARNYSEHKRNHHLQIKGQTRPPDPKARSCSLTEPTTNLKLKKLQLLQGKISEVFYFFLSLTLMLHNEHSCSFQSGACYASNSTQRHLTGQFNSATTNSRLFGYGHS